jgi:hypothetical protein
MTKRKPNDVNPWLERQIKKSGYKKGYIAKSLYICSRTFSDMLRNKPLHEWRERYILGLEKLGIVTLEPDQDEIQDNERENNT